MNRSLHAGSAAFALLLVGALTLPGSADTRERLHLQLDRSAPEAEATVPAPSEIRLWFSQEPQAAGTSLRLIRDGAPLEIGDLKPDPEDASVYVVALESPLAAGSYTVAWRAMAADGHVVRGEFPFTVQAAHR
ncbi:MAG TPA: copper resistance CopC family protein [Longimicrobiales bacterium]|nr:copper resistance CopC family protein [Longimicrobiales bacterium]